MNLDSVKLSQLRILIAVAERGNFSEAALDLAISQSAVSHAIANLEEQLGVVLLTRGRHGATLTPVGDRIISHARSMMNLLEIIGKEANLEKGLQGGQVRLASFRSVATHVLPSAIALFHQRFPNISITITELPGCLSVEQMLREGRADVGITLLPSTEEFDVWELLRDEYLVLVPANYAIPNDQVTWAELQKYPLILPSEGDECRRLILEHCARCGHKLNPTYEVREDSTVVGMVKQGLGVAIIARLAAEPLPTEVKVYGLPIYLERVIGVAISAIALHPPATYAFLEVLKEYAEQN
jgi:DNA-binding transcriptional LysR family regulator